MAFLEGLDGGEFDLWMGWMSWALRLACYFFNIPVHYCGFRRGSSDLTNL